MKTILVATALALFSFTGLAAPVSKLPVDTSVTLTTTMNALNANTVGKREVYGDSSNELGECAPVTAIFARGTIEPGNIGLLAGPPFFDVLSAQLGGKLGVQGVPYG